MGKNIGVLELPPFDWADGKRAASLEKTRNAVLTLIGDSIAWYQAKRAPKRWLSRGLRISALILGVVAASIPTVSEIVHDTQSWWWRPGLATIIGIVVGALILVDKLIGASTAWVRFAVAETALKHLYAEFGFAYVMEAGTWAGKEPTIEQAQHALGVIQRFLVRANELVLQETNEWKIEFQSALQQVDDLAKAQAQARESGMREAEARAKTARSTAPIADRLQGPGPDGHDEHATEPAGNPHHN